MGQMNRISRTGLELIKGFEGLRRRSQPLPGGGWIVGYGHTRSAREGVEVTEREAEFLLRYDLQTVEKMVMSAVHAPLNQNEFDALVSFAWNIGEEAFNSSDVLRYINAGEMLAAAESFAAWRKARIGGRLIVVDALVRRRAAEKNLFLTHPSGRPSAPSLLIRPELDVAASVLALSEGALSVESRLTGETTSAPASIPSVTPALLAANSNADELVEDLEETSETEAVVEETSGDVVETEEAESSESETTEVVSEDETETLAEEAEPVLEETIEDAAEVMVEETVADVAVETVEDAAEESVEAVEEVAGSIWDATDEDDYEELTEDDTADEEEDAIAEAEAEAESADVDDTLLAAAIAASSLGQFSGRETDEEEADDTEESDEIAPLLDLSETDDETSETEESDPAEDLDTINEDKAVEETAEAVSEEVGADASLEETIDEVSEETAENTAPVELAEDVSDEPVSDDVTEDAAEAETTDETVDDVEDAVAEEIDSESATEEALTESESFEAVEDTIDDEVDALSGESEAVVETEADDLEPVEAVETETAETFIMVSEDETEEEGDTPDDDIEDSAEEAIAFAGLEDAVIEAEDLTDVEETEPSEEASDLDELSAADAEDDDDDLDDVVEEIQSDEEIGEIWQNASSDPEEASDRSRKCIVDPLVAEHYPEEIAAQEAADAAEKELSGGRRSAGHFWFGILPFGLLTILGGAMCAFGALDWWGLVSSDQPVEESQLYAGPFLTLIGGFGFVFGLYFLIRKLMGAVD